VFGAADAALLIEADALAETLAEALAEAAMRLD
jgi:hypothetical protein